jgi:hypothetical protein
MKKRVANESTIWDFYYLNQPDTIRFVEKIDFLNNCHNNSKKDNYTYMKKESNYYGKKRRRNYSDYC